MQRCHQVATVTIVCSCVLLWETLFYICVRHQVQHLEIFWWCHCNGSKYNRDYKKKKDWTCIVRIMHKKCVPLQFHLCEILCDRKPFPCLNLNYSSAIIYNSTLIIEKGPFLFPIIKWYLNMNLIKCTTIDQVKKYPNHAYLIWWYHYIRGKRVTLIQYGQVVNKTMK